MTPFQILGLQFALSLVLGSLLARWHYAVTQGIRLDVQLGAAYYIPVLAVPVLLVTHVMIFALLRRRRG